ncbi:MAG: hypothetical protein KBB86_01040 [Candidatus Pacebacteria bacterium]|nr:hypothetical protein [Candidatus Paceibacterota bacterium]
MNPFENPTPINNNELIKETLLKLSAELGFVEDDKLTALKNFFDYRKGFAEEANKYLLIQWSTEAGSMVEKISDSSEYAKAQIGLMLSAAIIYKNFGENEAYADNINDAIEYAYNIGLDDIVTKLESLL